MSEKTFEQVLDETGFFLWKSVGCSMLPLIREGRDRIFIRKRQPERLKKYEVVLFRRPEVTGRGKYVLHRILRVNDNGTYWIVGDNCFCGETVEEENILGTLTYIVRKGKTLSISDVRYRIYTHLWCDLYPVRFFVLRCGVIMKRIIKKLLRTIGSRKE